MLQHIFIFIVYVTQHSKCYNASV